MCVRFWVNCKVYTAMILVIGLAVGVVVAKVISPNYLIALYIVTFNDTMIANIDDNDGQFFSR